MNEEQQPIRVGIAGIMGRMGHAIAERILREQDLQLVGGLIRPEGEMPENAPWRLERDPAQLLPELDVLIDATLPESSPRIAGACIRHSTPLVCGVTGLDDQQLDALEVASERVPVWYARNLTYGANTLLRQLPTLARQLAGYDVRIVERHHTGKQDIPSGTSLAMARAVRGDDADDVPIESIREGEITGEHLVIFCNDVEEIAISHRALSRDAFAAGAVRAVRMLHDAEPGWYGPEDLPAVAANKTMESL